MKRFAILFMSIWGAVASAAPLPRPGIPFAPRCYRVCLADAPPRIDGRLDDRVWMDAAWTDDFVDIEGDLKPKPPLRTRVKMAWDNQAFYIAARMEEPHLWATYDRRDMIIYHENDFEVFIDPDGDNHNYYELEINALNTVWDLLIAKPYRDGGPAIHAWDIAGLRTAVVLRGSLNDPADIDQGWDVELAIPWDMLAEAAGRHCPPADGDRWRLNFSRVEWDLEASEGFYGKRPGPEHNWVWSPQGLIAMHYPEMWGIIEFSTMSAGRDDRPVVPGYRELAADTMMALYYAQRDHRQTTGAFAARIDALEKIDAAPAPLSWPPTMIADRDVFHAHTAVEGLGRIHLDQTGRIWWTEDD